MSSLFDNSGTAFVSADGRVIAPLSYEQEGIWLASRFAAGAADFHNISALRLEGDLDVARLESALTAVANRHQILRSIFISDDTRLGQRVLASTPIRLPIVEPPSGAIGADWKTEAFEAFFLHLGEQPFDLAAAPPWRACLVRVGARDHVLVCVFHHILIDAVGSLIFNNDLAAFYNDDAAALPQLPMQYAEYATVVRSRRDEIARDLEAWREHLAGSSRSLTLPHRAQKTAPASHRRGHRRFQIDAGLASDVERLARQHNGTMFTALAAALAVTLSRIGGDTGFALNVMKSTRRRPELEPILGVLVDTLLLRVDLAAPQTFAGLLQQLRERLQWGFARPVPHFELVRALGGHTRPAPGGGDVAINYHKVPIETAAMHGLRPSLWRLSGGHAAYALALEVYNDRGTLECLIDFDATHLASSTIERIVEGLDAFLRAAVAAPLAPLDSLPTVTASASAARLREQPRGASTEAHHTTVPALFAQQVRTNPNGLAIRDQEGNWTAGVIDEHSSRLANLLLARGVRPGDRVGICLPRSADFAIAALAVMKAGAAYVPIDPAYPVERIRLIVEIAEPACIISHTGTAHHLPPRVTSLLIDGEHDALATQPAQAPAISIAPDSVAYVLFTSGSTGRPRGVAGLHRGIVNRVAWMRRTYPFWNDEACAQKTTIGFVDSVWEIFGPLTSGVPLVVLPDSIVSDARALVKALAQHNITRVVLVPSLLEAVLDASVDLDASLQRLRLCISSGEPLSPALAARCRARLPHVTLLNIYGSSEVAADVTWAEITDASIRDHVSIGRPIDNVHIYLLDRARQLVSREDEGEIYVGGAALAAGYVGDDAATAERFVPDPFGPPGARLFKTGDLGRVNLDGEIEVIGRLDQQIKLLGRRIEPGEVESALVAHPSIRQAAVVLNRERDILSAFVVSASPDGIDRSALREFLRRHLPDYMVPAVFVTLAQLPLSAHGKIDRAELASRSLADSLTTGPGDMPATPLQQQLTELWTEVLGATPRSIDDDFVAMGGHSLRATQLIWRIHERLGIELSPGAVFEHSTVRLLASEVGRLLGTDRPDGLPPIVPVRRGETTLPSAAQRQFWLEERLHDGRGANQHGGTYLLNGPFDIAAFDRSLTALLARHESLRSVTRADGGELRMVVKPAAAHVSPIEDLSRVAASDRQARLDARLSSERRRPFALDSELPFRVRIYRLASDQHAISFNLHHSAFDGWSAAILMRELAELYRAQRHGGEAQLPALPIQYADFAEWQRVCVEGTAFTAQRDYWRRQLADAPTHLELPLDRQPRTGTPRMGRCPVSLNADLVSRLRALGQAEGATTFMTLSAGYATLLARYSGQWDVVIGTAAANRRLRSTQSIIGAFINTLALRFTLDPTASFSDTVRIARTVTTEAFAHQDVPFDVVVADVAPQRHADRSALFQALFVMQDRHGWRLELDGLDADALETPPGVTAIPLSLVLHEDGPVVQGFFEYRSDLFDAGTIERMSVNYLTLLNDAAAGPATALRSLSVVSDNELTQLRDLEGAVGAERAWERLDSSFARHADQTPDAPAVATLGAEFSYRDIHLRAEQVAARLIALGVEPGNVVAIEMPRSVPLFVAILGVLQAGAAFVVIDPKQPADRRRFIAEDSGAVVLISDGAPSRAEDSLLLAPLRPVLVTPADPARSAHALACLVYTSGSSGEPKGVRITHRNIAAMSEAFGGAQGISAASRVAQMVSPAFDVALSDIFSTWLRGACLCILDPADSLPGKAMVSALTRLGVTHWTVTPSMLAECPAPAWPELETIAVGGEPPSHDVLARWTPARVVSAYGLTEATVASTAEDFLLGQMPAIGRPLPGTHVAIVDGTGKAVPIGVPGQMVIAGPQVADGYHRRPELTAERFPHGPNGPRLCTFDRARWRADGRIEFLGRLDRQLKFNGYRIEPGEIEAAARSHEAIDQAFVTIRRDDGSGDRLVAYVITSGGRVVSPDALRAHLRTRLPSTMCPTDVMFLDAFPRTTTGKVDERALPAPENGAASAPTARAMVGHTEEIIAAVWRDVLGHERFGRDDSFFDAGGHSLLAVRAHDRLAVHFRDAVSVVDLFAHPTITALARHLEGRVAAPATRPFDSAHDHARLAQGKSIAIIGMACRYPKSRNVEELWQNLVDGVECLRRLTPEELTVAGVDSAMQSDPRFVPVAGVLDQVDQFDAEFFGFSAAEARQIDPQQRLLLELAATALDAAGYDARRYPGRIGVFAGVGFNTYLHDVLYPNGIPSTAEGFAAICANDKDFAASRVAYRLDLRGPAVTVQTACSTSLVAVDIAIQSLLSGRCDMALAGGVSIRLPQTSGYRHEEGMILSPDGHCRPFDASAAGTVGSNGGGVVLLKPLDAAIADGDPIEGVILGSASNNDGRRKVGFTAPGVEGQVEVIRAALAQNGVDPGSIHYIETHGTGTTLGDPIEIQALNDAYGRDGGAPIAIGSIKSNLGHTDAAAGVAGLIKAALALKHNRIPRSLHFDTPNPHIDFGGRLFVADRELSFSASPRRAAVSAFGIGGTNAHVILEQPPVSPAAQAPVVQPSRVLPVSARSEAALRDACVDLARALGRTDATVDDVAYTLQQGRREYAHRHVVIAGSASEAQADFETRGRGIGAWPAASHGRSAWLFSGQGSQQPGMARVLYESQPIAREWIDVSAELARRHLGRDLRDMLCGDAHGIHETRFAQPALFALQYALARTWQSFGVTPSALIGHSIGEYAAACLAGVFSLEDAMFLVCERGRLMHECPTGSMLSVRLSESDLRSMIAAEPIDIAAVNAPGSCVVSGDSEAIARFQARLTAAGRASRLLFTERAFHSRHMATAEDAFERAVKHVRRSAPAVPIVSTVSGEWLTNEDAMDPVRWRRQMREPVRFFDALRTLDSREALTLIEIGSDNTLAALALQIITDERRCITSSQPSLPAAVGRVWAAGTSVEWNRIGPNRGRRVPLPAYPFQRAPHWGEARSKRPVASLERPIDEWFSIEAWYRSSLAASPRAIAGESWLLVADEEQRELAGILEQRGAHVSTASSSPEAVARIRADRPSHVVLCTRRSQGDLNRALDLGLHRLLDCVRALGDDSRDVSLTLVTEDVRDVTGSEDVDASQAPAIGVLKVVPYEYPHIRCRHIDVSAGSMSTALVDELTSSSDDASVAHRGGHRWLPSWPSIAIPRAKPVFRDAGTYLITGGFGGVGLTLARHLGESFKATVALVGRSGPPASEEWTSVRAAIEAAGGTVCTYAADVGDAEAMRTVVEDVRRRFGAIHGCVHAAGVIDRGGVMHRRDRASMDAAIRAKVHGTEVLSRLLQGEPLDFLILCSTLASLLPQAKFGQAGYAAANEYLDAFAASARRRGIPATAINWSDWSAVGMSAAAAVEAAAEGRPSVESGSITPAQGLEVLLRLAASPHARVAVSSQPIDAVRREIAVLFTGGVPAASTPPADPGAALRHIWADALGASDLSPDSNFFTLGGHSLMAIQVLTRVRDLFEVTLPLAGFLDQPTLGRQTQALERALAKQAITSVTRKAADTDEDWAL
jgi:amino acid adenylation domain-containing protein